MPHYFKALTPGRRKLLQELANNGGRVLGFWITGGQCSLGTKMQSEGLTAWKAGAGNRHSCRNQVLTITDKGRSALERGAVPVE